MNGFRRLIIKTAEVMMVLLVIVTIFSFAASGWMYGVDLGPGFFAPVLGFIIGGLVSMGMPGFSGFVAEFPIFMGVWQVQPVVAVIAILGVLITAAYILLVVRRVFFGELPEALVNVGDVTLKDKISTVLLAAIMIALGIFPSLMAPMISSGVDHILALLGGA